MLVTWPNTCWPHIIQVCLPPLLFSLISVFVFRCPPILSFSQHNHHGRHHGCLICVWSNCMHWNLVITSNEPFTVLFHIYHHLSPIRPHPNHNLQYCLKPYGH